LWDAVRSVVTDVIQDFSWSWRGLALTDIAYKAVAFAILTPATVLLLRLVMSSAEGRVIADVDIATFFLTRPIGILTLVLGGALVAGITALEMSCLMAIGIVAAKGGTLTARDALAFGAARALPVLRLTMNMVVRLVAGLLPFLVAAGIAYWVLLRQYDINYYLAVRPPVFWVAAVIAGLLLVALAAVLVRTIASWALALPLLLFENAEPRQALGESARRSATGRGTVVVVLVSWAIFAVLLLVAAAALPEIVGRTMAPRLAGSLALLLLFIAGLVLFWAALGLVAGIVNASLFALAIVRLYLRAGEPRPHVPEPATVKGGVARIPRSALVGAAALVCLDALGVALLVAATTRRNQPVLVIAHRGSSAAAPENSLAAFRLAVEQDADFIEFDVQESVDGEVVVMHDSDLMRVGGSPLKVWEANAADLRAVDIGSRTAPRFSAERVPTLAETLAVSKGGSRVVVELKSYGHDERLEEKVVAIVEAAGMVNDSIFMSLDHAMVRKIKQLRPSWRAGVLVAKAIGDLTSLGADFLAVEARLATRAFVRQAHRAGQDVYVWTVNDPAWMLAAMSNGVDGLITDKPDVARLVVQRRAAMSDAQRLVVALLVRLGAHTDALAAEDALRP
jgi:glycerophosphoryl diester phosphodiesterase